MNPEQVKQIVETIKTLNININDATTQKLADAVIPLVRYWLLRDMLLNVFWGAVLLLSVYIIARAVSKFYDKENR